MSKFARKVVGPSSPRWQVPLFLSLAFLLGVGASWLYFGHRAGTSAPAIASYLPPGSATASVSSDAQPPDISALPVAEGARVLGNWNYDRQNWAHAIEHYEQAIAGGTDNPDIRTDLGNCYRFLSQPQKALEEYEIAQKQDPRHENSLFNQISLFADLLNDKNRAAAAAGDFLARFPQSPQAPRARKLLEQSIGSAPTPSSGP